MTQELEAHGISEAEINTRGLRIKTTIDRNAQSAALSAIRQTFGDLTKQQRNMKNALVAVDPKSGAVLAYYGGPNGKNYAGRPDFFDYAGQGWRPPGSSFKPYTLAAALAQNLKGKKPAYAINSVVDGSQTRIIGGIPISNDPSDAQYSGHVTLAFAMKVSLNTAFDGLAYDIGPGSVAALAHAAGIPKTRADGTPTLQGEGGKTNFGIGIGDYPVRPIDQAVGFSTFANGGVEHDGYLVQSVTDANGNVLYEHKSDGHRALDPKVANDVTLTLEPIAGFSGDALDGGRPSAAKTGTEGIGSGPNVGKNSDAWMVGFTPQVSAAVWVGSGDSTHAIYNSGGGNEYGRDLSGPGVEAVHGHLPVRQARAVAALDPADHPGPERLGLADPDAHADDGDAIPDADHRHAVAHALIDAADEPLDQALVDAAVESVDPADPPAADAYLARTEAHHSASRGRPGGCLTFGG